MGRLWNLYGVYDVELAKCNTFSNTKNTNLLYYITLFSGSLSLDLLMIIMLSIRNLLQRKHTENFILFRHIPNYVLKVLLEDSTVRIMKQYCYD